MPRREEVTSEVGLPCHRESILLFGLYTDVGRLSTPSQWLTKNKALLLATVCLGISRSSQYWVGRCFRGRFYSLLANTWTYFSNAKTGGLADDFKLTSNQYSVILLLFFVSYVIFEVPSNMIIARVRPSLYLCTLAVLWGLIAALMALTNNWQQLAGVRFVLGFIESGFAPGIAFYLSSW